MRLRITGGPHIDSIKIYNDETNELITNIKVLRLEASVNDIVPRLILETTDEFIFDNYIAEDNVY